MSKLVSYAKVEAARKQRRAAKHATFDNIDAMDAALAAWLTSEAADDLTETQHGVLTLLAAHSCVVPSVSWMSVPYMAEQLAVSERTIQRSLSALTKMGVITRVEDYRNNGARCTDFIVMSPPDVAPINGLNKKNEKNTDDEISNADAREGNVLPTLVKGIPPMTGREEEFPAGNESAEHNTAEAVYEVETQIDRAYPLPSDVRAALIRATASIEIAPDVRIDDIVRAVKTSLDVFYTRWRRGHTISDDGAFFRAILRKEVQRRIYLRKMAG